MSLYEVERPTENRIALAASRNGMWKFMSVCEGWHLSEWQADPVLQLKP